jgi:Fibronectin type III domain
MLPHPAGHLPFTSRYGLSHQMPLLTAILAGLFILPLPAAGSPQGVTVSKVTATTIAGRQLNSSSKLQVTWTPTASDPTDHFEIIATETAQGTRVQISAAAGATAATLTGLKSHTTYSVTVRACANAACTTSSTSSAVSLETDREEWQFQGSGSSVTGLTKAVSDGNARLSATRMGPDAGAMANRVQLYYGPLSQGASRNSMLSVAVASDEANAANPDSYLSFTSRAGSSGLASPSPAASMISIVATGQGVPIARERGGFVRLFFEATGADNKTRVFSIDSKDGYFGLDFNAGSPSTCSTAADYDSGGCVPTVAIGVDGDSNGNSRITNARQQKVGWPTLDSPHWDLSAGTFMVFTVDRLTGCSTFNMNHGYAVWDGAAWKVQYQANGCPKLFTSAQAAFPFHSGGGKYRLYYGDPSLTDGKVTTSNLPFLGPKKLIYADASVSGDPNVVDFEDWESQSLPRDVVFLWPNGDQMDARAEGYIDDYHFLTPTGSQDLQVMYVTITDGAIAPIAVTAILRNP